MIKVIVISENESVIYGGKIYKSGSTFEADDEIAKSLIERGYVAEDCPPICDENESDTGESEEELEEISYTELRKLAASKGLSTKGKKEDLIERINEAKEDETEASEELPNTAMPE